MSWTVFSICYSSGPVVTSIDFLIRPRWVSDALISRENIYIVMMPSCIFLIYRCIYIINNNDNNNYHNSKHIYIYYSNI